MKANTFLRFFSGRKSKKAEKGVKSRSRQAQLYVERLEKRELLSVPRIKQVIVDSSTAPAHPTLQIIFTENMQTSVPGTQIGVDNPANYLIFDSQGRSVPVNTAAYNPSSFTVTLGYNSGANLTAGSYTLFVHGENLVDTDDSPAIALAPPGQLVVASSGTQSISTISVPGNLNLNAISNYQSPSSTGTGSFTTQPSAVAIANVYNDFGPSGAIPALIVANQADDTISIFRGLATGGFATQPTNRIALPTGSAPDALVATDIIGAGFIDLAVADSGTNSATILLNDGLGNFSQQTYLVGKKPNAVAVADMNGDNRMDVLVADAGDNNVNILTQTKTQTFNGAVAFATGRSGVTGIAVADFNGDGLNDFVVSSGNGVAWLPNTSIPVINQFTFGAARVISTTATSSVAAGELDSDNAPDIAATTSNSGGQVLVFTNDGTGNFTSFAYAANPNPTAVQIAQVYGTGHNDLLVANDFTVGQGLVSVLKGAGTAGLASSFAAPVSYTVDNNPIASAVHVNASGVVDLAATASTSANAASVLTAKGDGTFFTSLDTFPTPSLGGSLTAIATGDLAGRGLRDAVVVDHDTNVVEVLLADPANPGSFLPPQVYTVGGGPVAVALGNLTGAVASNGTPVPDIVVVNNTGNSVTILKNKGNGTFTVINTVALSHAGPTGVALGDFNGDGKIDMAISHNGSLPANNGVTVMLGNGDGTFGNQYEVVANINAVALATGSFSGNSCSATASGKKFLDLAVVDGSSSGTVTILHGQGNGQFVTSDFDIFPAGESPNSIVVADFNGDGLPDIAVSNQTLQATGGAITAYVSVLLNTPGVGLSSPIRTNVLTDTDAKISLLGVTHLEQGRELIPDGKDAFPDLVMSIGSDPFFIANSVNDVIAIKGQGDGTFGAARLYATNGGGPQQLPTVISVASDPFIAVTTFTSQSNISNINLALNGSFQKLDLADEKGNLTGWQTFQETDSKGGWDSQTGNTSPLSEVAVPAPPVGAYAAMLDEPNAVLLAPSALGYRAQDPVTGLDITPQSGDYNGMHIIYQDIRVPASATSVTLSYRLFIDNSDPTNNFGYSDPSVTPQLDYFPNVPPSFRPANQQVRVDIMDPTASITDVNAGLGGGVLQNIFITSPTTPRTMPYTLNPNSDGTPGPLTIDLTRFAGKVIRLRIAEVNNKGKLIVGLDDVQVNSIFPNNEAPSLTGVMLRNPGIDKTTTFGGKTTDTTIIGQVNADGSDGGANNIDHVMIDPDGEGFGGPNVICVTLFDATGHFQVTLPALSLPGTRTVGIEAIDRGGNATATSFTFTLQGPSLTTFQAQGPGPVRFTGNGVAYKDVSGKVTAIAVDPRDPSGNVFYVGSDNGGVWKTTDGGSSYTPLTDFLNDPTLGPISASIGALAIDPSNPDTIYAGTGVADLYPTSHAGFGILKSVDGGQTWTLLGNSVFNGSTITTIAVSDTDPANPTAPTHVYVAVASGPNGPGLWRSDDGGQTWTSILAPSNMSLDNGSNVAVGTPLASVTDIAIDRLSASEEVLWVGMGNVGLAPTSTLAGVWKSVNAGGTWLQQAGGHDTKGTAVLHQKIPVGTDTTFDIGEVKIALPGQTETIGPDGKIHPVGRPGDEGIAYAFINNRKAPEQSEDSTANLDNETGIFKTKTGGQSWTHVMLRENVQFEFDGSPPPLHNFEDITLTGGGIEQDAAEALIVDPQNSNVVYFGGSNRFIKDPNSDGISPLFEAHPFIRVDTTNMRDTTYVSPFKPYNFTQYPNDGDDIYKAADAAFLNKFQEPGVYPTITGVTGSGGAYKGEGVFWYDLQQGTPGFTDFTQLRLPATIHALVFDGQGRLLVGTEGGIWRGVSQGFQYDSTGGASVGGDRSIEGDLGVASPSEGGMILTDINGNLQIADITSVAIDPIDRHGLDASAASLGWSKHSGTLTWGSTNDITGGPITLDPFVGPAPFAGIVRTGPRDPANPTNPSVVYRTYAGAQPNVPLLLNNPPLQFQVSNLGGIQGSFTSITNGIDLTGLAAFPDFAVNPSKINAGGVMENELLYAGTKVFESDDGGNSWQQVSNALVGKGETITALAFGTVNPDVFYVGTSLGKVFVTLNNGADGFPLRDTGLPGLPIGGIVVDSGNSQHAFIAVGGFGTGQGHVFQTTDGGNTWVNSTGNLPDVPAYAIAFDPRVTALFPQGRLWVGTQVGVFVSTDLGNTWAILGEGLPHVPVVDLQFDPLFEKLAVATQGRSTFEINTDLFGPRVVGVNPATPTRPGIASFTVTFDKPVDPRTFTVGQVKVFQGPAGPIVPLSVVDMDPVNHQLFQINFVPQFADGTYTVSIGPQITDFVGNPMDQNNNGVNGEDPADRFTFNIAINTTDDGRFITGNYHDLLNRPADTSGFLSFLSAVDTARLQQLPLFALSFVSSQEARGDFIYNGTINPTFHPQPTGLYATLLHRAASQGEINGWVNLLNQGVTPEQVIIGIAGSIEYFNNDAGGTNTTFVQQLYLDLLHRQFDNGGLNSFVTQLEQAEEASRDAVAQVIDHSPEYYSNLVASLYSKYLRPASPGEVAGWVARFEAGTLTQEQLIATLLGSDEYFASTQHGGGTNNGWINAIYKDLFNRSPDPSGQAAINSQLAAGIPRYNIALGLLASGEYQTDLIQGYYSKYLGRTAGSGEVANFAGALQAGATDENVISTIVGSAEYFSKNKDGGTTMADFDYNWVSAVYVQVLPRPVPPSKAEAAPFLNSLSAAEDAARTSVVGEFVGSQEYRTELITQTYVTYLGRLPSPGEVNIWLPLLAQPSAGPGTPSPDEQFLASVLGSGEYFSDQRVQITPVDNLATNQQWIESLYNKVFGRVPDPAVEVDPALNSLLNGYLPQRLAATNALIGSTEHQQDFVTALLKTYLRRAPNPGEVNSLVGQLQSGTTDEQLINNMVSGSEYFLNPNLGQGDNSTWLNQVFLDLLGRGTKNDPSAQNLLNALNVGTMSRAQVANVILTSGEYRTRLIEGFYSTYLGRTASTGEVNGWIGALNSGTTDEQVIAAMITSKEYFQRQISPARLPLIYP
jgi:hypothetical protein